MLGLVHFQASAAGYPMTTPSLADRGLTPFGFDLLADAVADARCYRLRSGDLTATCELVETCFDRATCRQKGVA